MTRQQRRAALVWIAVVVACVAVALARHGSASTETAQGLPYPYQVDPVPTAAPVESTTAVPSTSGAPAVPGPATTTEEARPVPVTSAAPDERATVAATAETFLHGWALRGTWDQRNDALKGVTVPEYLGQVFPIDPDRVGLPPGQTVTADPARVTITEAGGATVPASIDGLAVVVHEVRTGDGWRVDSHTHG